MKAAILNALKGTSGQHPFHRDQLEYLGKDAEVNDAITSLLAGRPPSINTARVMRGGVWSDLYWLTGGVEKFNMRNFKIAPPKDITPVKPSEKKEDTMTRITSPAATATIKPRKYANGVISLGILRQIVEQPGISREALLEDAQASHPDVSYNKLTKCIWDLLNTSKTITQQGVLAKRVYFPTGEAQAYLDKHGRVGSLPTVKPATPAKPINVRADAIDAGEFSLMLSDDYSLFINLGDEVFRLDPAQVARLDRFMARVMPDGVRA